MITLTRALKTSTYYVVILDFRCGSGGFEGSRFRGAGLRRREQDSGD